MKLRESATYCSSCFSQMEDKKYVDFDAYWDGPVLDKGDENQSIKVAIDDLVLCENCLEAAASLIGMIHNKKMRTENFELGRALETKNDYIQHLEKIVSDLDHTVGEVLTANAKRGAGRPQMRLPDHLREKVA